MKINNRTLKDPILNSITKQARFIPTALALLGANTSMPAAPAEGIIVSRSTQLWNLAPNGAGPATPITPPPTNGVPFHGPAHPVALGDFGWLYFDATDSTGHTRLWRQSLLCPEIVQELTTDPWGNSQDIYPLPCPTAGGPLAWWSNRQGLYNQRLTWSHYQGPGYGVSSGGYSTAAAWLKLDSQNVLHYQYYEPLSEMEVTQVTPSIYTIQLLGRYTITNSAPNPDRMSAASDRPVFVISSASGGLYLYAAGTSNFVTLSATGHEGAFHPLDPTRIVYVDRPAGSSTLEVFTASVDLQAGVLTNITQITFQSDANNYHPTWYVLSAAPTLAITASGGYVSVAWPSSVSGYHLEQAASLEPGASWSDCSASVSSWVYQNQAWVPCDGSQTPMFFRLAKLN